MLEKLFTTVRLWIAQRLEHCKDVGPLFSKALDGKLRLSERIRIKLHLWMCGPCTRYVSNLSFMHDMFQTQRDSPETEQFQVKLNSEAKERLKKAIQSKI
jgi:hypothetical protein